MLTVRDVVAVFPALSTAVPEILWFKPSVLTLFVGGHVAIPDKASEQVNATATLVLFQPAALGAGVAVELITGETLSIFTVSLVLALFPATSVAVPLITCLSPWLFTVIGAGHVFTPAAASL